MSLTLEDYAEAKKLDLDFLKTLGLSEHADKRGAYIRMPYVGVNGEEGPVRQRFALDGPNRFKWKAGEKPTLYGLHFLAAARAQNAVVLVEGESDCHTLWRHGFPALGLPGAGAWRETRDAALLDGIEKIYVVHEGDNGGDTVIGWLAKSSIRRRARIVRMAPPLKDPSALHLADPNDFKRAFDAKLKTAQAWSEIETARAGQDEQDALEACRDLASSADILSAFRQNLAAAGLVGEDRNAQILYLALTSRLLKKIVSVAYKGPSSGGKSFAVDRVLAHFPDSAVVPITSMSDKALIFMQDDLAHRHLIIAEANGAAGEVQDYLLRTLLSEGRLEHRMADKTPDGIAGRHIVKEGPTGLVITTTKVRLHPENETRLLSLQANDTLEQTRAVLLAVARRDRGQAELPPAWRALQTWLGYGERRVAVPYAEKLAALVSAGAVRMRRDFGTVLSLIEARALLHRLTRARDAQGRIVATLDDYAAVRALVFDLVAEGVAATVSKEVREAVEAVRALAGDHGVGVQAVAARLNLDRSAAGRRCQAARLAGYIVNEESRRGHEARFKPGNAMPGGATVLPSAEDLAVALGEGALGEGEGGEVRHPPQNAAPLPGVGRMGTAAADPRDPPPPIMSPPPANGEAKPALWRMRL